MYSYDNDRKLTFEEMVAIEETLYAMESGCERVEAQKCELDIVCSRSTLFFRDKDYNLPQNIFLIKYYNGKILAGRKLRSALFAENKINAINCSMITADMLLGVLVSKGQANRDVWIEYHPFEKSEKRFVFDAIKQNNQIEILYPFLYREFESGLEEVTPSDGWDIYPEKAKYLGFGEEHLRKYTLETLKSFLGNGKISVFDPACSTGEFLHTLKMSYPEITTIGQDLSASMVEYARPYVDVIYCGDSISSPVEDNSIDIIFFRFLNSEVVSQNYAHELFSALMKKLSASGIAVLFGHTAVLLDSTDFINAGYEVYQSTGYSEERNCIFQYYIIGRRS